jgi:hypothetical protein
LPGLQLALLHHRADFLGGWLIAVEFADGFPDVDRVIGFRELACHGFVRGERGIGLPVPLDRGAVAALTIAAPVVSTICRHGIDDARRVDELVAPGAADLPTLIQVRRECAMCLAVEPVVADCGERTADLRERREPALDLRLKLLEERGLGGQQGAHDGTP